MKLATLFVYYKVQQSQHAQTIALLAKFKEDLKGFDANLSIELLQRPEVSNDGFETWMEVYRHPEGVSSSMLEKIQQSALESGLPPNRKNEIFIPLE